MEQDRPLISDDRSRGINYIIATFIDPQPHAEFDSRSPNPYSEMMLSCRESAVMNCYHIENGRFMLKFQMKSVLAKAETKAEQEARFTVNLTRESFVIFGMNFAGRLLITHRSGIRRLIFLPGCLSYDPCGVTGHPRGHEFLTNESALFLHSLVAAQVKAAQQGAPEQFMDILHKVHMEADSLYINRPILMKWMTEQVIFACYPKQGAQLFRHFPEFVIDLVRRDELDLSEQGRGHTKLYLEEYLRGQDKEDPTMAHPPYQYYYAIRGYVPAEQLSSVSYDPDKVSRAAEQQEAGRVMILWYLPRVVHVGKTEDRYMMTFRELRQACEGELSAYHRRIDEVDHEIITEVKIMRESQRDGEKCSVF